MDTNFLPALNAILNGVSGFLLLIGYKAIRKKAVGMHKTCMLSALVFSSIFLASYLYYHFVVKHGEPTRFSGEGFARVVYFSVLVSHIVLAIVMLPLAIYTAYLGLRGNFTRHVRVARWTFPIWLYVSVTGVVVYLMLYQIYPGP